MAKLRASPSAGNAVAGALIQLALFEGREVVLGTWSGKAQTLIRGNGKTRADTYVSVPSLMRLVTRGVVELAPVALDKDGKAYRPVVLVTAELLEARAAHRAERGRLASGSRGRRLIDLSA